MDANYNNIEGETDKMSPEYLKCAENNAHTEAQIIGN